MRIASSRGTYVGKLGRELAVPIEPIILGELLQQHAFAQAVRYKRCMFSVHQLANNLVPSVDLCCQLFDNTHYVHEESQWMCRLKYRWIPHMRSANEHMPDAGMSKIYSKGAKNLLSL